ncbi:MAG: type II/IV secretion system ATPase subunit, partial [Thermosphaera sp.]
KLAHMSGKHISIAYPVLDAMLPEKHRVAATYGHEVSVKGPSFTIRKFREKPFSVIELIEQGNIDSLTSAYIWLLLEHGKTFMVAGGTGTGKTTLLNALSMFIKPGMKIVTIEDTPELNLPHVNWVQLTSREVYIAGAQSLGTSVKLYDLVKLSLRYRPDYIIVGEVRGDEAFVLFQAMATGHSGASTIHAETLDYAVKRLTSPPMNIPPTYMRLMNVFMHVQRVITRVEKGVVKVRRRITVVQEVEDFEKYIKISTWDPRTDSHIVNLDRSIHLQDIAAKRGLDVSDLIEEVKRRSTVLEWMLVKGIRDAWDVSRVIFDYYYEPMVVYEKAKAELEELLKKEAVEMPAE